MADIKKLCLLGATGSVGRAALEIVRKNPKTLAVETLVANRNVDLMRQQYLEFRPKRVIMSDIEAAEQLRRLLTDEGAQIEGGQAAVNAAAAEDGDTVIAAIAGAAGLSSVLAAAQAGKRVLLANKESLVVAGHILMQTAQDSGAHILPIDSEHAALCELLEGKNYDGLNLWLTASGGALRQTPTDKLSCATVSETLAHPTWNMGAKITVDSATMMNKVLEIIEASILFNVGVKSIHVALHPQSIVHAMVEEQDGTLTAQMAYPDMRLPIARALSRPLDNDLFAVRRLSWRDLSSLTFSEPSLAHYPCLSLASEAMAMGGAAPAMLSAANETAVLQFLKGAIKFTDIARINIMALEKCATQAAAATLDDLWAAHQYARRWAKTAL